jgi:imidazolonepropionase-like amidohydrolase
MERDDALIEAIARKGIIVSPTISVGYRRWTDDGRKAARADLTRALFAAGCKVAMSTDCGIPNVPHEALADALDVVHEMTGMIPVDILKLATSASAAHLDLPDRGTIEAGKRADLLVVDGNPLKDLAALKSVRHVVAGGRLAV